MADEVAAPAAGASTEAPPAADAPVTQAAPEASGAETPPKTEEGKTEEKPAETPEQAQKRSQSRIDRRINAAYRRAAEEKARADLLEKRLSEMAPAQKDPGEPNIADFTDVEEYAAAKAKYASEKALKTEQETRSRAAQTEARQKMVNAWEERVAKADTKYEDFDEVVGDLQPNSPFTTAIMQADNGDDIAYYLGKNIAEAQKIAMMDPLSQVRAIGRLEAKLAAEPPKVHRPSSAPPPIKPVGGANVQPDKKLSETDWDEFVKRREKMVAARR